MIRIKIDGRELEIAERDLDRCAGRVLDAMRFEIRAASFEILRYVKILMPVDTGKARATWGDIWDVEDDGMTIEQGTTTEYTVYLNEGHSYQAPAGFIDGVAMEVEGELETAIIENFIRIMNL